MYYLLGGTGDAEGRRMSILYKRDHRGRSFITGQKFIEDENAKKWHRPPEEPIRIEIEKGYENGPKPSFFPSPVPLMSAEMLNVIRGAGVDNIDAYKAELFYHDGKLYSDKYYVINVVGLIAAADLTKSEYDDNQGQEKIAMSFDSLVIDENKTFGSLMFRLAESVVEIIVHEKVKQAVEDAGIQYVKFYETEISAIL